jgi:hypothetical protein
MQKYIIAIGCALVAQITHAHASDADKIINYLEYRRVQDYRERQLTRHLAPNDPAWMWITTQPQPQQSTPQDLEAMARMLGVIE